MTILPAGEWRQADGLMRVVAALQCGAGGPRIVGGAVRNSLLGLPVADIDLATAIPPLEVIRRLEAADIKAIPTGIDHGTVTAVASGGSYEITTLRRDISADGRHAIVAFSDDWREDAARRDFTINALYADPKSGEIYDYFGGLADLEKGDVRFIGDPEARIAEDYLRILRYFRFFAHFGRSKADQAALTACARGAPKIMALSRERIASELIKILTLPAPLPALILMIEHGIFAPFLPELDPGAKTAIAHLIARERMVGVQSRPVTRLLALMKNDADAAAGAAMRLKLSRRMQAEIAACMAGRQVNPANIRAFAYAHDIATAREAAMLHAADTDLDPCLALLTGWQAPIFPIKGGDIIRRGVTAGPMVAKTLRQIELAWIDEGFPGQPRLDSLIDQAVGQTLLADKK